MEKHYFSQFCKCVECEKVKVLATINSNLYAIFNKIK